MKNSHTTRGTKKSPYEIITDLIIERLEQGEIPWHKPWNTLGHGAANFISKKEYRGINALILNSIWSQPHFLTFNQTKKLGGTVKKGSKSTPVTYWNFIYLDKDGKKIPDNERLSRASDIVNRRAFLRIYRVFNQDQIEGIEFPEPPKDIIDEDQRIKRCESLVDKMPKKPKLQHVEAAAYYHPRQDFVNMPAFGTFNNPQSYYQTLFHELAHSTGHESRLAREGIMKGTMFGTRDYSFEELVAELTASFVSNKMMIDTEPILENTAGYIQGWLKKLNSDPQFIIKASTHASKAADWILGKVTETVSI